MPLSPLASYQTAVASGQFQADQAQEKAILGLESLHLALARGKKCWWQRLGWWRTYGDVPRGVYLYGAVGAGKTWLMDIFYQTVTVSKWRVHFHVFMREIHRELRALQGHKNPLARIATHLAKRYQLICFDEFFVEDIADAMLLGELFQQLFQQGLVLVATSNVPPEELYRNGLQRARFLPAIAALKQHMTVMAVRSLKDYRWRTTMSQGVYFQPLDAGSQVFFQALYRELTAQTELLPTTLHINQRDFTAISCYQDVLWLDFAVICSSPRSIQDYVVLSQRYRVFFLDNVPLLTPDSEDPAWYLIGLVDVFYDAHCRLVIRAAGPMRELYQGTKFTFEFRRTLSRLHEMQGASYWGSEDRGQKTEDGRQ